MTETTSHVLLGQQPELDRERVGGKAHGLNHMMGLGLPVPPAFVLPTDYCRADLLLGNQPSRDVTAALVAGISWLEEATGRSFGAAERPLLVSVRSGAAQSMPGMMDTILNLGINVAVEQGIAGETADPDFAADTHSRFRDQYERVVGVKPDEDPWSQLAGATTAVFESWHSSRATAYRNRHGIPHEGGTAVTIQAMVFGNVDDRSGTGVLFTRNPLTGEPTPFGEWLPRGQGEDVVSGRHDPLPLSELERSLPTVHEELMSAAATLERLGRDVQDIEFTVESGRLWLLQTRAAKRSPHAAVRLAVGLVQEGVIGAEEALRTVSTVQLERLARPSVDPRALRDAEPISQGEPACPGVASGRVVTDVDQAEKLAEEGVSVVLARPTTDPDDVQGMLVAVAILTEIGGSTSHAAVVSRELGTPCIVGCGVGTLMELEGEVVTVDAYEGRIYRGVLPVVPAVSHDRSLATLRQWAERSTTRHAQELLAVLDS